MSSAINNASALGSLISGCRPVSALSNAAAFIFSALDDVSWVGFYIVEGDRLLLGPFRGEPACIEISSGQGVCGKALADARSVVVPDVLAFPGHIACDPLSRSEIVVPLKNAGRVVAVLDIDSRTPFRFSENDLQTVEEYAMTVERILGSAIDSVL